jgi:hypothetical protein
MTKRDEFRKAVQDALSAISDEFDHAEQVGFEDGMRGLPEQYDDVIVAGHIAGLLRACLTAGTFAADGKLDESGWHTICAAVYDSRHAQILERWTTMSAQQKAKQTS